MTFKGTFLFRLIVLFVHCPTSCSPHKGKGISATGGVKLKLTCVVTSGYMTGEHMGSCSQLSRKPALMAFQAGTAGCCFLPSHVPLLF